jgi:hypothetical protein
VIGFTVKYLDTPTPAMLANGIEHAIGETYNAPQATLMATLIKGLLSFNLDWQFVLAGCFIAVTMELCGIKSLSFAVGLYLPLATTLPIWIGGVIRGAADWMKNRGKPTSQEHVDDELGKGSALAGVVIALLSVNENVTKFIQKFSAEVPLSGMLASCMQIIGVPQEHAGHVGYQLFGVACFLFMGCVLYGFARRK